MVFEGFLDRTICDMEEVDSSVVQTLSQVLSDRKRSNGKRVGIGLSLSSSLCWPDCQMP